MAKGKITARKGIITEEFFEVAWHAMRFSFPRQSKGKGNLKILNLVKKRLVAISHFTSKDQLGEVREQNSGPQELLMHGLEFDKLKAVINDEEIPWTMDMGDQVEEARNFINDVNNWPEVELGEST